jgi:hypothetical protein
MAHYGFSSMVLASKKTHFEDDMRIVVGGPFVGELFFEKKSKNGLTWHACLVLCPGLTEKG